MCLVYDYHFSFYQICIGWRQIRLFPSGSDMDIEDSDLDIEETGLKFVNSSPCHLRVVLILFLIPIQNIKNIVESLESN